MGKHFAAVHRRVWVAQMGAFGVAASLTMVNVAVNQNLESYQAESAQPAYYTYQSPGGAGTAGMKVVALTFDDGPGPYTPQILSVLEHYDVPATFFEIGINVVAYPQYARVLSQAGYPVENHTWTHANLTTLSISDLADQIDQTQSEIKSVTGKTSDCVRPPYDAFDTLVLDQIAERGLTTMSYSVDSHDWSQPGTQAIVHDVVAAAFPGAVVDLHDGGGDRSETVAALPEIIVQLRAEGYRFVSICGAQSTSVGGVGEQSAIYGFGATSTPSSPATSNASFVGMAATPDGKGYWLVAADGGVFSFGDANFYGSEGGQSSPNNFVAMVVMQNGEGYLLLGEHPISTNQTTWP